MPQIANSHWPFASEYVIERAETTHELRKPALHGLSFELRSTLIAVMNARMDCQPIGAIPPTLRYRFGDGMNDLLQPKTLRRHERR